MGQINLYKMELSKKEEFLSKIAARFELRGKLIADEEGNYEVRLYTERPKERKPLEWQWILDEYECELSVGLSAPKAVLVIISEEGTYSVTYGLSYFMVDKYCDVEFAFDFARRIPFKQIKTTTLTTPHSTALRNRLFS